MAVLMHTLQLESSLEVLPRWPLGTIDARGLKKQARKYIKMMH